MCVCVWLAERPGRPGPEKPRHTAAEDSRLCGPGGGAAGRATLCRVRPKERRLSSRILNVTSGPPLHLSVGTASSRTLRQSHSRAPALQTPAVFDLQRHSHFSSSEIHMLTQTWKMTQFQYLFYSNSKYSALLLFLELSLCFEVI